MADPKALTDEQIGSFVREHGIYGNTIAGIFAFARAIERATREQIASTGAKYDDVLVPFVALMRRELHANSGKGDRPGWLSMSRQTAMLEIWHHAAKLQKAALNDDGAGVREYAADVANMAMMLVDVCGVLGVTPYAAPVEQAGSTPDEMLREALAEVIEIADGWHDDGHGGPAPDIRPGIRALATPTKPEMQSVHPAVPSGKEKTLPRPLTK